MGARPGNDSDEGVHESSLAVLDRLEATRENLDEEQVRRQEFLGRSHLLVHQSLVGRRVLDGVGEGIDRAARGVE